MLMLQGPYFENHYAGSFLVHLDRFLFTDCEENKRLRTESLFFLFWLFEPKIPFPDI